MSRPIARCGVVSMTEAARRSSVCPPLSCGGLRTFQTTCPDSGSKQETRSHELGGCDGRGGAAPRPPVAPEVICERVARDQRGGWKMLSLWEVGDGTGGSRKKEKSFAAVKTGRAGRQIHSGAGTVGGATGASGGTAGPCEHSGPEQGRRGRAGGSVGRCQPYRSGQGAVTCPDAGRKGTRWSPQPARADGARTAPARSARATPVADHPQRQEETTLIERPTAQDYRSLE